METAGGASGSLFFSEVYMEGIRAICDKYGIMLIFDEIMVGIGRTGKLFCFEHYPGVLPDFVTFAKGLTASIMPL